MMASSCSVPCRSALTRALYVADSATSAGNLRSVRWQADVLSLRVCIEPTGTHRVICHAIVDTS